jgi:hypothetical protein
MHKYILAAVFRSNKTKALGGVKPFYSTNIHKFNSLNTNELRYVKVMLEGNVRRKILQGSFSSVLPVVHNSFTTCCSGPVSASFWLT